MAKMTELPDYTCNTCGSKYRPSAITQKHCGPCIMKRKTAKKEWDRNGTCSWCGRDFLKYDISQKKCVTCKTLSERDITCVVCVKCECEFPQKSWETALSVCSVCDTGERRRLKSTLHEEYSKYRNGDSQNKVGYGQWLKLK